MTDSVAQRKALVDEMALILYRSDRLKCELVESVNIATVLCDEGYVKQALAVQQIIAEIEQEITAALKSNYDARRVRLGKPNSDDFLNVIDGKIAALRGIEYFLSELKKKYSVEQAQ